MTMMTLAWKYNSCDVVLRTLYLWINQLSMRTYMHPLHIFLHKGQSAGGGGNSASPISITTSKKYSQLQS